MKRWMFFAFCYGVLLAYFVNVAWEVLKGSTHPAYVILAIAAGGVVAILLRKLETE